MARVRIKGFTVVRDVLGAEVVEIDVPEPATVAAAFQALLGKYGAPLEVLLIDPETGTMAPFLMVLNGEIVSSTLNADRSVKTGDEIVIIFPIGGG